MEGYPSLAQGNGLENRQVTPWRVGSNPTSSLDAIAQWVEQRTFNPWAAGSNPARVIGYSQVVRQRTLTPSRAGSNPATLVSQNRETIPGNRV